MRRKRAISVLLSVAFCFTLGGECMAMSGQMVEAVTDGTEVSQLVQDYWEEDYFDQMVIHPDTEQVTVDGERTSLEQSFGLEEAEAEQVLESPEAAEDYFRETPYEAEEAADGTVVVTAPFQTKRIVVNTRQLSDPMGAERVLRDEQLGQYVLQYATQEEARAAYEIFQSQYGTENCFVDEVIDESALLQVDTMDSSDCYSWGAAIMGLDQLKAQYELAGESGEAVVAVVDTGVDETNFFFEGGRIHSDSRNLSTDEDGLIDVMGHGTHVAGIIADCTPDNVKIMALRVYNRDRAASSLTVSAAIRYAVSKQADVINMSIGWPNGEATYYTRGILDPAIEAAYQVGIPIICAAGNDQQDVSLSYPACSSQTIAVSSLNPEGTFDAVNSNFGSGIDFAAPGVDIASAEAGGEVCTLTGTSMAAPHLAAAVAYVKLRQPAATVPEVYTRLQSYAVDIGDEGKDDLYGWGYVRMGSYYLDAGGRRLSCKNWKITLSQQRYLYDGTAKTPEVTVKENGKEISSKFYSVAYQNNRKPGTATVVVTGTGIYQGTVKKTFSIGLPAPVISSLANSASGISLKWKRIAGAEGYYIYHKSSQSAKWGKVKTISSGKTLSWKDTAVKNGIGYRYLVRAFYGKTDSSGEKTRGIIYLTRPALIYLIYLKNTGKRKITLKWKQNTKATGYQVQYALNSKFSGAKTITVSARTVQKSIKYLKKGRYYYVRMRSYRKSGQNRYYSAWSPVKKVKVKR